ncbi:hypothetical protein DDE82_004658 [Stemphylium lycopersici]|uniref:Uncharacterized protein n=1 Tax=Stemphylium lycopersici TaxID=183478 RepID=A0A364N8X3_STELY|nr:hypothetical protein TW65_07831 [Stemphylium lycopersici]RAR04219.1 hypothetical protein DDE82_004658 [Stemphylium lycopersici]RAR13471.1 hypothetical protein DDE83_003202 [Stemphylium lycopersici]
MSLTPKSTVATTTFTGLRRISKGFRAAEHTIMATHASTTIASAQASESTIASILSVVPQTLFSDTVAAYIVVYNKVAPIDYSAIHWALGLVITAGTGATVARFARNMSPSPADLRPKRWQRIVRWLDRKLRTDAKLRRDVNSVKKLIEGKNDNLQTRGIPTDDASDVEENSQFGDIFQAYGDTSADDDSEVGDPEWERVRSENVSLHKQLQKQEEARTNDQQMLDQLRHEKESAQTMEAELRREIQQSRDLDAEQTEEIAESNKEREDLQKRLDDKTKRLDEETKRRQRAERKLKDLQGSVSRPSFFSRIASMVTTPHSKPSSTQGSPSINASSPVMSSPLANYDKPVEHGSSLPHAHPSSPPPATKGHASNNVVSSTKNLITNQIVSILQDTSTPSSSHQTKEKTSVKWYFKDEVTPEEFNTKTKKTDLPPPLAKRPRDTSDNIETPRPVKRLQTDRTRRRSGSMSPGPHQQAQKMSVLTPSGGPAVRLRMPRRQQASIQPTEAPEYSNVVSNEQERGGIVQPKAHASAPGPSKAAFDHASEEFAVQPDEVVTDEEIQAAIEQATPPSHSMAQQAPANDDVDMAEHEQPANQSPQPSTTPEAAPSDTEMLDNYAVPPTTTPVGPTISNRMPRKSLVTTAPATARKSSRLASKAPQNLNERALASRSVSPQKTEIAAAPSTSKRKALASPASSKPQGITKALAARDARTQSPAKKR